MTPLRSWTLIGAGGKSYASDAPGTLGGHRLGKLYGRLDCRAAALAIGRGGYITRRGKVVAGLVPPAHQDADLSARDAIAKPFASM
jgi:hypothetical protein